MTFAHIVSFSLNIIKDELGRGADVLSGPHELQLSVYSCSVCVLLRAIGCMQSKIEGGS